MGIKIRPKIRTIGLNLGTKLLNKAKVTKVHILVGVCFNA